MDIHNIVHNKIKFVINEHLDVVNDHVHLPSECYMIIF